MLDNGNVHPDVPKEAFTGYTYEGKEIVAVKPAGRPPVYKNPSFYNMEKKTDAATLYCVYGSYEEVAKLTDVPVPILKQWKQEPWWIDIQKQVFQEQNEKLSGQISRVLNTTIENLEDRLVNGDTTYNPKTGEITRKPIEAKVLASLFESLSHQRRITRGEPTAISARVGVDDRLKTLEDAFIRFAKSKTIEGSSTVVSE